jgi:hypothetical protein
MVVHGPGAFDHGDVARLLERIHPRRIIVAGVMARTAAEESGFDVEFDGRPPSRVIAEIAGPVFLVNRGKTPQSGRVFGDIVASRLGGRGLVHVECAVPVVYTWDGGDPLLALGLCGLTGFDSEDATSSGEGTGDIRQIRGCVPGEPVFINGIVIGRATGDTVSLRHAGDGIEAVSGIELKPHGLEKLRLLPGLNLGTAWCKSGPVRSAHPSLVPRAARQGRIVVVDHCGHRIYEMLSGDCCGVLAIGDDTTAVCGHVCVHRGIPVLGITDQDCDTLLPSAFAQGSVILDTRPERDDDLGGEIAALVPDRHAVWEGWVQEILDRTQGRAQILLDLRDAPT